MAQDLPVPLKNSLESKFLRLLWEDEGVKEQIQQYSLIPDDLILNVGNAQRVLSENFYSEKLLKIGNKKFAPINNNGLGNLENTISSRLFTFPEKHPIRVLLNNPTTPTTVPKSKELEISMQKEVIGLNREKFTQELFGRPPYNDSGSLKACLKKASDLESCFNQSEQAFVTWLEKIDSLRNNLNELPHCFSPQPFSEGKYLASKIQVDFYSFLDICRFCRGTMAYMLGTGKMMDVFMNFFKNKLGVEIQPTSEDIIQVFAFSYEKTNVD